MNLLNLLTDDQRLRMVVRHAALYVVPGGNARTDLSKATVATLSYAVAEGLTRHPMLAGIIWC